MCYNFRMMKRTQLYYNRPHIYSSKLPTKMVADCPDLAKVDIIVESWRRGSQVPLSCSATYHANDALEIKVGNTSEFKYTKDHSKMARSVDATRPWVCIGDINRMTSQYVRGGGTNCISSAFLWKAFNVIKGANTC
uniref:Deoxyribonuclease-2-alpha n=1 Tax=Heterorhabditis bacteriophora TaxID=37862 RepID=A0A1I7WXQ3_HETBA